jgi:NADPH:quinone reductase-like Zn-dependent oxidoreductase
MKAVRINQWGQPTQIEEVPQPTPGAGEVLVRVHAASVNPVDRGIALGYMADYFTAPLTLGTDFAGDVVAVGEGVTHVKAGDAVYGMSPSRGTFADYAVVNAAGVAHQPRTLEPVQAAAVPLTGLSAWQLLFNLAQLQSGDRLLIHGAGGGIGSLAVQLAKHAGAYVIAQDKTAKAEFVKQLGADEYIDAERQRFEEVVGKVDVVLDLVGGDYVERSFNVLEPGGRYATPAAMLAPDAGKAQGIVAKGLFTQPSVEELTQLAQEIDAGNLKVFVHRTFPLAEAQTALFYKAPDGSPDKVVITIH